MPEIILKPSISSSLIDYWSHKYGESETLILIDYVEKMVQQFYGVYISFEFYPTIAFHFDELPKIFPGLKKSSIKKAFLSLKKNQVIDWYGDIKSCGYIFFINHKELFRDAFRFSTNEVQNE